MGLQGDIEEHVRTTQLALERLGWDGEPIWVKKPEDIQRSDALIIPGGESTVIGSLSVFRRLIEAIKDKARAGMPVLGTCAGMITLAKKTYDRVVGETNQPLLAMMDILVERNAFGRQRQSFEINLQIPVLGETSFRSFRGVFIRSPSVKIVGPGVQVLSKLNDTIVAVEEGRIVATAFHPELSGDSRFHEYFLGQLQ